jgi:hypothetical protein
MAVVDGNNRFMSIEIGAYDSLNDSGVFRNSPYGKLEQINKLNISFPRVQPIDAEGLSCHLCLWATCLPYWSMCYGHIP